MNASFSQLWGDYAVRFAEVFAAVPAPIAPEAHQAACLRDACECCADESLNLPEEAK